MLISWNTPQTILRYECCSMWQYVETWRLARTQASRPHCSESRSWDNVGLHPISGGISCWNKCWCSCPFTRAQSQMHFIMDTIPQVFKKGGRCCCVSEDISKSQTMAWHLMAGDLSPPPFPAIPKACCSRTCRVSKLQLCCSKSGMFALKTAFSRCSRLLLIIAWSSRTRSKERSPRLGLHLDVNKSTMVWMTFLLETWGHC